MMPKPSYASCIRMHDHRCDIAMLMLHRSARPALRAPCPPRALRAPCPQRALPSTRPPCALRAPCPPTASVELTQFGQIPEANRAGIRLRRLSDRAGAHGWHAECSEFAHRIWPGCDHLVSEVTHTPIPMCLARARTLLPPPAHAAALFAHTPGVPVSTRGLIAFDPQVTCGISSALITLSHINVGRIIIRGFSRSSA